MKIISQQKGVETDNLSSQFYILKTHLYDFGLTLESIIRMDSCIQEVHAPTMRKLIIGKMASYQKISNFNFSIIISQ